MFAVYVAKNGVGLRIGLVTAVANKGEPGPYLVRLTEALPGFRPRSGAISGDRLNGPGRHSACSQPSDGSSLGSQDMS